VRKQTLLTDAPELRTPTVVPEALRLTEKERDWLLRVVERVSSLKTHYELFLLAQGEVQDFLPHRILISVWGDFATGDLGLDIISTEPSLRTADLGGCAVRSMVENIYTRWVVGDRRPLLLEGDSGLCFKCTPAMGCGAQVVLREMRSGLVHGIKNERDGTENLYLALDLRPRANGDTSLRQQQLAELLISLIDLAFRKISVWKPIESADEAVPSDVQALSVREQQIMNLICIGKSSAAVADILNISQFTVKNHLHRIFRKLGVANRTEAASRYREAGRPWVGQRIPRAKIKGLASIAGARVKAR
jgi:transcriptional regulator EpsA